jgi:hypothetical protein
MSRAMKLLGAAIALVCGGALGCDRFDPPPAEAKSTSVIEAAEKSRASAREALTKVMKAAQAATATCVASDLRWEADNDGYTPPRHYSRPCIPERCEPTAADIEALRTSAGDLKKLVEGDANLRVPSFQGFVALSDAMVSFVDTATAKTVPEKDRPARLSGLSMHYGALAAALREIYADVDTPLEPPSLGKSLEVARPGGDVCKGWGQPEYCDVKEVRLPKTRKWRTDPACIEVESVLR